jgi:hypothetical protein
MKKFIDILELLINQYVFITNNKEKANIAKAREDTKNTLNGIKALLLEKIEEINAQE